MKKILKGFIVALLFVTIKVQAESVSFSLSCPDTALAGSKISCSVKVKPEGFECSGVQADFSFSGGASYSSFDYSNEFIKQSGGATGFLLTRNEVFTSEKSIGTLVVSMPDSGSATVSLTDTKATKQEDYKTVFGNSPRETIRIKATDNNLSSLSITGGTLSPAFNASTTSYTASIDASSTTISATSAESHASVTGTGNKTLNYGTNTFTITVTSESGVDKSYTIVVTRPDNRENINTLKSLTVSGATLSPSFASNTLTYSTTVVGTIDKVTISATPTSSKASISGTGEKTLVYGSNTFDIVVTSEKGETKTYSIKVTRTDNRSSNNYLKDLTTDNGIFTFNKNTNVYAFTLANEITTIKVGATAEDLKAKVSGTGTIKLKEGINTIVVAVTAENGKVKNYTLTVTRLSKNQEKSSNTNFTKLEITDQNFTFNPEILEYDVTLTDEETLNFDYLAEDATSVVTITGNENLKNGSVIEISITSTDGSVKTYKINIIKEEEQELNTSTTAVKKPAQDDTPWGGIILGVVSILVIIAVVVIFIIKNKKRKEQVI